MHRFNGWKHLTWTVESNVDLTVAAATLPHVRTHSKSGNFFTFAVWVGTTPGLCPGFCQVLKYFFCLYSLFICAKSIKWQDQSWYLGSPRPTATENVQYTNCELSHTCLTSILSASSSFFRSIFHIPIFLLWYLYLTLWKNDFLFALVQTKNTYTQT